MTAPVLTSIVPGAGPLHSSAYFVRFYLPTKFQSTPPTPLPELNLKSYTWNSHYIAVRKFSGFARDTNIVKEAEKLATSLSRSPWANSTSAESSYAYSIAQYNSPFRFIGRVNEVWVDVNASGVDGYKSSEIATYWHSAVHGYISKLGLLTILECATSSFPYLYWYVYMNMMTVTVVQNMQSVTRCTSNKFYVESCFRMVSV